HSARFALESMRVPEAGQALMNAAEETTGPLLVGILQSLKVRHEGSVEKMVRLAEDPDPDVAVAATAWLGDAASPSAIKALFASLPTSNQGERRNAIYDALLAAANKLLANGDHSGASAIFEKLANSGAPDFVRTAAYCGSIKAMPDTKALDVVASSLKGP